ELLSDAGELKPTPLGAEQTNTSVVLGDKVVFKLLRRVENGENPDLEMSRYLTEKSHFFATPVLGGWLDYSVEKTKATVGVLHQFVANQGDAWRLTLDHIHRSYEWALTNPAALTNIRPPDKFVLHLCGTRPAAADEFLAGYVPLAHLLAERTADLHLALSAETDDAA